MALDAGSASRLQLPLLPGKSEEMIVLTGDLPEEALPGLHVVFYIGDENTLREKTFRF